MEKGVVKMIDHFKGYGFIVSEEDDELYFNLKDLHPKYRNHQVREGETMAFDVKREMKGDRAVNLRPV
ncbi:MAG: cold shock domain-containing protein [Calditrichia bacterium]